MATLILLTMALVHGQFVSADSPPASSLPSATSIVPTSAIANSKATWMPVTTPIPYPYFSPSLSILPADPLNPASTAGCTALLSLSSRRLCYGQTSFLSTTTATIGIDCAGCPALTTTYYHPRCNAMGGCCHPPLTVATVTTTPYTEFAFSCAVSAAFTPTYTTTIPVAAITHTLPLPVLQPTQTPGYTPVALSAMHYPNGICIVDLDAEPTASGQKAASCSASVLAPTVWALGTTTSTIGVDCDGCEYVWGGDLAGSRWCAPGYTSILATTVAGPGSGSGSVSTITPTTVTVTETKRTVWVYGCASSAAASRG